MANVKMKDMNWKDRHLLSENLVTEKVGTIVIQIIL